MTTTVGSPKREEEVAVEGGRGRPTRPLGPFPQGQATFGESRPWVKGLCRRSPPRLSGRAWPRRVGPAAGEGP